MDIPTQAAKPPRPAQDLPMTFGTNTRNKEVSGDSFACMFVQGLFKIENSVDLASYVKVWTTLSEK